MIVLCNPMMFDHELVTGCAFDPVLGGKIHTYARCYGNGFRFCDIWVIREKREILGAISQYNGTVTIVASPKADMQELAELLQTTVGVEFESSFQTMERLRPHLPSHWRYETTKTMVWKGEAPVFPTLEPGIQLNGNPPLGKVHDLLCEAFVNFQLDAPFVSWYVDVSSRMRRNLATIYTLEQDGVVLSSAGIYYGTLKSAVISCVGTHPHSRGHGYGRFVVYCCVKQLLEEGRTPYLIAAEPPLISFYEALGFACFGGRTAARIR